MGLDAVPLSRLLISFSDDLLSSFIGRSYITTSTIFKTSIRRFRFPPPLFPPFFLFSNCCCCVVVVVVRAANRKFLLFRVRRAYWTRVYRYQSRWRLREITILINLETALNHRSDYIRFNPSVVVRGQLDAPISSAIL